MGDSSRSSTLPGMLRGSADYVFFDASGGADNEKKKQKKKAVESEVAMDSDSPPGKVKAQPPSVTKKSKAAEGKQPSKPYKAAEPKEPKGKGGKDDAKGNGKRRKK